MPAILGPAIIAASHLLSSGIGAASQGSMNKKTRKWNEKMYERERADSLADWNMQNEYNSPLAQMQRLKEGGLNPNLVYGDGATHSASPVRNTDVKSWNPQAPTIDLGGAMGAGLGAFYNMEMKEAQLNNLETQNKVLQQDAVLRAGQVVGQSISNSKLATDNARASLDFHTAEGLQKFQLQAAEANLNKTLADTKVTLDENERRAALQAPTLAKAAEEVLNLRMSRAKSQADISEIKSRIQNLDKDAMLKQLDIELKRTGVQPGDKIYWRILSRILNYGSDKIQRMPADTSAAGKQSLDYLLENNY